MDYTKIDYNQMLAREILATIEAAAYLTWLAAAQIKEEISNATIR